MLKLNVLRHYELFSLILQKFIILTGNFAQTSAKNSQESYHICTPNSLLLLPCAYNWDDWSKDMLFKVIIIHIYPYHHPVPFWGIGICRGGRKGTIPYMDDDN